MSLSHSPHSPHSLNKNLFISTYGCQMNVYDSDRMADLMAPHGYVLVDSPDQADMVIINTCHIREKASEKLFSELGRIRDLKEERQRQGKTTLIAVTGCVAQAEGDEIKRRAPCVDIVLGPQAYHRLPELVASVERKTGHQRKTAEMDIRFPVVSKFDFLPETERRQGVSAFLTVQEGCDKFCTFCVVPYTRGSEYSRSVEDIRKEAKHLVALGAKELVLLGQNVNAYHGVNASGREVGLGVLIQELASLDGVKRIRYMTSHPRDMDDELYHAHAHVNKLMPFLHLPVQSGSNKILEAMNRKHTREDYLRVIDRLRDARPDLVFSSDFIVGFPGETERDFEDTLDLVRRVGFVQTYSFKYSPRPGTPGALMDQVPEDLKQERLFELQSMLKHQQEQHFKTYVGQTMDVLVESVGREPGTLVGRTPYSQVTHLLGGPDCIGQEYKVLIERALSNSLSGQVVEENKRAA